MRRWRLFSCAALASPAGKPKNRGRRQTVTHESAGEHRMRLKVKWLQGKWNQGQSLVEFALLLPVITWVLLGAVDFGRLYFAYVAVTNASRVGVEYGMDPRSASADVRTAIKQECPALNLTDADITLAANPAWSAGSELTVTVQSNFDAVTPLISEIWGGGPLRLTGRTVARFSSP
jgi:hypothetical protein